MLFKVFRQVIRFNLRGICHIMSHVNIYLLYYVEGEVRRARIWYGERKVFT